MEPRSSNDVADAYRDLTFLARGAGVSQFFEAVLARIGQRTPARILDLGCGTGDLTLALARSFPQAEIVGLDISTTNIAAAEENAGALPPGQRPTFVAADYTKWSGGGFDFVLADGVLHLLPMADHALARKLAADTATGGELIATIPGANATNHFLLSHRRLWRMTPVAFDRLALAVARRMHPGEDPGFLAQRIPYLRVIPERLLDDSMVAQLKEAGLALVERSGWASPSFFKLRHEFVVFAKS